MSDEREEKLAEAARAAMEALGADAVILIVYRQEDDHYSSGAQFATTKSLIPGGVILAGLENVAVQLHEKMEPTSPRRPKRGKT